MSKKIGIIAALIGILLGAGAETQPAWSATKVRKMDWDQDGYKEAEVYFEGGLVIMATLDHNADKLTDATIYYKDGFRHHAEVDSDFDGQKDTEIEYYFTGVPALIRTDKDRDGTFDSWKHFKNGFLYKKEWDRNKDGAPDYRVIFEVPEDLRQVDVTKGQRLEKFYDDDFDGQFEKSVKGKRRWPIQRASASAGSVREERV